MSIVKPKIVRQVSAVMVAPIVVPVLMLLFSFGGRPAEGAWVALFALQFTMGTMVVFGLPLYFLFRKFGWTSAWGCVIIGALCGLLSSLFLFASTAINAFQTHQFGPMTGMAAFSLIFCFLGSLSGIVFWLIARPDKTFVENRKSELS